jgi:hypothetical protein
MTLSCPRTDSVGHVIVSLDWLTRHAAQMDREPELKIIRRAFAKQVMAASGVRDTRVEAAFAVVAREDFLGPGPWQIVRWGGGYRPTADPDPVPTRRPLSTLFRDKAAGQPKSRRRQPHCRFCRQARGVERGVDAVPLCGRPDRGSQVRS